MKVKKSETLDLKEYSEFLEQVKNRIRSSQLRASLAVNGELIQLYWWIGHTILNKQSKEGWGTKVIERLAKDLSSEFPGIAGFSSRNLKYMRKFAEAYPDFSFVQAAPAQIPWWHNVILLEKLDNNEERVWYAQQIIKHGWSYRSLEDWIKSNLYQRQGKALTNFQERLPLPQSHLAQEITKNPYNWDFLCLADGYREKELEDGLIAHIQKFLLELGAGFAFMGRQYHLEVDGDDYYIDLLFYHARLHCYVAIELKAEEFKPEHAGKMNFYLAALDATLKSEHDNPSIGMILCKKKSKVKVEYAFRNCTTPIGVATYETQIIQSLPKELKGSLPTIAEIEAELSKDLSSN
jgi:predicted nuclease of restriction endonuclease-like (RecB) superfamily